MNRAWLLLAALLLALLQGTIHLAAAQRFPLINRLSENPNNGTSHELRSLSVSSGADAVTFVSSADLAGLGTEGTRHVFLYEAAPQTLTQITQPSDSALLGASRRLSRGALWAIPWPLRGGGENGCAGCGCLRVVERGGEAMMKKR